MPTVRHQTPFGSGRLCRRFPLDRRLRLLARSHALYLRSCVSLRALLTSYYALVGVLRAHALVIRRNFGATRKNRFVRSCGTSAGPSLGTTPVPSTHAAFAWQLRFIGKQVPTGNATSASVKNNGATNANFASPPSAASSYYYSPSSASAGSSTSAPSSPIVMHALGGAGGGLAGANHNSTSSASAQPSANTPCRFFNLGQCNKGSSCPFLHKKAAHFSPQACKFFTNGFCRNGDACPFSHDPKSIETSSSPSSTYVTLTNMSREPASSPIMGPDTRSVGIGIGSIGGGSGGGGAGSMGGYSTSSYSTASTLDDLIAMAGDYSGSSSVGSTPVSSTPLSLLGSPLGTLDGNGGVGSGHHSKSAGGAVGGGYSFGGSRSGSFADPHSSYADTHNMLHDSSSSSFDDDTHPLHLAGLGGLGSPNGASSAGGAINSLGLSASSDTVAASSFALHQFIHHLPSSASSSPRSGPGGTVLSRRSSSEYISVGSGSSGAPSVSSPGVTSGAHIIGTTYVTLPPAPGSATSPPPQNQQSSDSMASGKPAPFRRQSSAQLGYMHGGHMGTSAHLGSGAHNSHNSAASMNAALRHPLASTSAPSSGRPAPLHRSLSTDHAIYPSSSLESAYGALYLGHTDGLASGPILPISPLGSRQIASNSGNNNNSGGNGGVGSQSGSGGGSNLSSLFRVPPLPSISHLDTSATSSDTFSSPGTYGGGAGGAMDDFGSSTGNLTPSSTSSSFTDGRPTRRSRAYSGASSAATASNNASALLGVSSVYGDSFSELGTSDEDDMMFWEYPSGVHNSDSSSSTAAAAALAAATAAGIDSVLLSSSALSGGLGASNASVSMNKSNPSSNSMQSGSSPGAGGSTANNSSSNSSGKRTDFPNEDSTGPMASVTRRVIEGLLDDDDDDHSSIRSMSFSSQPSSGSTTREVSPRYATSSPSSLSSSMVVSSGAIGSLPGNGNGGNGNFNSPSHHMAPAPTHIAPTAMRRASLINSNSGIGNNGPSTSSAAPGGSVLSPSGSRSAFTTGPPIPPLSRTRKGSFSKSHEDLLHNRDSPRMAGAGSSGSGSSLLSLSSNNSSSNMMSGSFSSASSTAPLLSTHHHAHHFHSQQQQQQHHAAHQMHPQHRFRLPAFPPNAGAHQYHPGSSALEYDSIHAIGMPGFHSSGMSLSGGPMGAPHSGQHPLNSSGGSLAPPNKRPTPIPPKLGSFKSVSSVRLVIPSPSGGSGGHASAGNAPGGMMMSSNASPGGRIPPKMSKLGKSQSETVTQLSSAISAWRSQKEANAAVGNSHAMHGPPHHLSNQSLSSSSSQQHMLGYSNNSNVNNPGMSATHLSLQQLKSSSSSSSLLDYPSAPSSPSSVYSSHSGSTVGGYTHSTSLLSGSLANSGLIGVGNVSSTSGNSSGSLSAMNTNASGSHSANASMHPVSASSAVSGAASSTTTSSTAPATSTGATVGRKQQLCMFFIEGTCKYIDSCKFVHGLVCNLCKKSCLFPDDLQQNEKHTKMCRLKIEIEESKDLTCALCKAKVVEAGRKFGLLPDCMDVICVPCLKEYRTSTSKAECPVCHTPSHFLIPSHSFPQSMERKRELTEAFKLKMSKIACKYFDYGNGVCKYGEHCHFHHNTEPGNSAGGNANSSSNSKTRQASETATASSIPLQGASSTPSNDKTTTLNVDKEDVSAREDVAEKSTPETGLSRTATTQNPTESAEKSIVEKRASPEPEEARPLVTMKHIKQSSRESKEDGSVPPATTISEV